MRRVRAWTLGAVLLVGSAALVLCACHAGKAGAAGEEEGQGSPAEAPPRVTRTAEGETVLRIDRATQERIGLRVEALSASTEKRQVESYGEVLDPSSLVALDGELSSAEAALTASGAEFRRVAVLEREDENMSRRSLEEAEARYRADESRVRQIERQIAGSWGAIVTGLTPPQRQELIEKLVKRATALVRATLPLGDAATARPVAARVVVLGYADRPLKADALFDSPAIDPGFQGRAFLLRVETSGVPAPPGTVVSALIELPGEPLHGVLVPRSAVIRTGGKGWVYVQTAEETFARREIALDRPREEGCLTTEGPVPGERVVVEGAQTLLSEEMKSQVPSSD